MGRACALQYEDLNLPLPDYSASPAMWDSTAYLEQNTFTGMSRLAVICGHIMKDM